MEVVGGEAAVATFIANLDTARRREEAVALDALFRHVTGFAPQLWSAGIIGYGRYEYRYPSGHSGIAPAAAFAPRKAQLVIYADCDTAVAPAALARLGKHKTSKACIYLNKLAHADLDALADLLRAGMVALGARYPVTPL